MKLKPTLDLYATAAGGQTDGSSLTHPPHLVTDTPKVLKMIRKMRPENNLALLKDSVEAGGPGSGRHPYGQQGNALGKKLYNEWLDYKFERKTPFDYDKDMRGKLRIPLGRFTGKGTVKTVPMDKIIATQRYLDVTKLRKLLKVDPNTFDKPQAVAIKDKYYLIDGHHRVSLSKWTGSTDAKINVITPASIKQGKYKVEAYSEKSQTDQSAFTGKKYRTQDTKYGHLIGEYDSEEEAKQAALARPYTRVLSNPDPQQQQSNRDKSLKKAVKFNPDEVK